MGHMGVYPLILLALLIVGTKQANFCSTVCKSSGCNGILPTNCNNQCSPNWVASGSTCIPNALTSWKLIDTTPDIAGGLMTVTPSTLVHNLCPPYSLYGWSLATATVTVTQNGINTPYYQLAAYVFILIKDAKNTWNTNNDFFTLSFMGTINTIMKVGSKVAWSNVCGAGNSEYNLRYGVLYTTYNTTVTPLTWKITTSNSNSGSNWGMKEFIVTARICNVACTSCYGSAISQCYTCEHVTPYLLNNNTCSLTCLSNFGITADPFTCIYCNLKCSSCFFVFDNCTSCTLSGTWRAYLDISVPNYPTCVNPCPTGYFANATTQACDACNINCTTCSLNADYCTSCVAGWSWYSYICANPCPSNYFISADLLNCTICSLYCQTCAVTATNCSLCVLSGTYMAYLLTAAGVTTCTRICPNGTYPDTNSGLGPNVCLPCNAICLTCTGDPSPCQYCALTYFLYNQTCISACPALYFADNNSRTCLLCSVYCVSLSINMYFSDLTSSKIYIDMNFNGPLPTDGTLAMSTFQTISVQSNLVTLDMFSISYVALNANSYRIIIAPTGYIFLENKMFTVTTMGQPSPIHWSATGIPFKVINYQMSASIGWTLINGPPFSPLESGIISAFSTASTRANSFLTTQGVQEIKKTGILSILFSGAQITSCAILANTIPSQNLYEGVRFWAIFVFFDAPPYQRNSTLTKYVVSPTESSLISTARLLETESSSPSRLLFDVGTLPWRFQRTGQTSFFIFDVYMPILLIVICWVSLLLGRRYFAEKFPQYEPKLFSFIHKVHEVTIMYVTMAMILEFLYFSTSSIERIVSLIICVICNLYFIAYELYIYYDMIKYPLAHIGNARYEYYVCRYGSFLKNIRYVEYDFNESWSPKQWFRPYNYHILSYYKKFIMVISLPLFYDTQYAQVSTLIVLQGLEIIRFAVIWPFFSKTRNIVRLCLQISLLLFFLCNIYQSTLIHVIMLNDAATINAAVDQFYAIGWAGFAFCFIFNIGSITVSLFDMCNGSNRSRMDQARRIYYSQRVNDYQELKEDASASVVNSWVKHGNLNGRQYTQLPNINLRVESYSITKENNRMIVDVQKILDLAMVGEFNYRMKNNTAAAHKINKIIALSHNDQAYPIFERVFKSYDSGSAEKIVLKTLQTIIQKNYQKGETIPLLRDEMRQKVEVTTHGGHTSIIELDELIEGFPLEAGLLK